MPLGLWVCLFLVYLLFFLEYYFIYLMVRPSIDYTSWRPFIENCFHSDQSVDTVRTRLLEEHGVAITKRTLERTLASWGISARPRTGDSPALRAAIIMLFYRYRLSDKAMVAWLRKRNHEVTPRGIKTIRLQIGLVRQIDAASQAAVEQIIHQLLVKEYDSGVIEDFGRGNLYAYMRKKYPEHQIIGR